ncbi:MAG: ABC transporter, partial [Bacillota bacterium]|nr:ABC transporter [Bacillota bacterium]
LFVNSLGWMCEHKNSISIHPKTLEAKVLTLPTADAARWSLLFVGVIPLIFLVAGIVVWVRRKRR